MLHTQITEAIRRFGVSDTTTSLLVVRVGPPGETDTENSMKAVVSGDLLPLTDLPMLTDWATVRKVRAGGGLVVNSHWSNDLSLVLQA